MTIPTIYDVGDTVKCYTSTPFKNAAGTATDPTTVTFRMKEPDGTTTVYVYLTDAELTKNNTGDYQVLWPATQEGRHSYRIEGTGDVATAEEAAFDVRDSAFY